MKLKLEFVKRDIAGEAFLVPVGEAAKKYSGLFALNKLGSFIWDMLETVQDENEIVDRVLNEYEVSLEDAEKDVTEFLDKLRSMDIIDK